MKAQLKSYFQSNDIKQFQYVQSKPNLQTNAFPNVRSSLKDPTKHFKAF